MTDLENISALRLWLILTFLLVARYFLFAGIPYLLLYIKKIRKPCLKKIQASFPGKEQVRTEIGYSLLTFAIYSLGIWLYIISIKLDVSLHYSDINEYGIPYFIGSIFVMILLHDTYFYWTHRLIHHKRIYKIVHFTHHSFRAPSPWSAFAFHPLEAIISMGIIPIIMFTIPWHHYALIIFISFMTLYDIFIHLGFHIKINFWQVSPAYHDYHHRVGRGNYSLYFTFWDQLMGTNRSVD